MRDENVAIHQYVSFSLGDELFAVEVVRAREILSLVPVTKVPQTPDFMLGVINLRGQVVPVVDMRLKLGLPAGEQTRDSCIIVVDVRVGGETLTIGAQADAVREVLELSGEQVEPAPRLGSHLNTDYIHGMGKVDEQFLILLDIDRVLSADDLQLVQEVVEEVQ